ncbi:MAG: glutamate mutase L [Anaerolineae bacterium]|jgi:hypothetical protein
MARDYLSIESILALECGSTTTQALLIDRVDGSYRIIARTEAPSSVEPPWSDVTAAVRTALRELSDVVGWRLLDEREQIIQPEHQEGGVDAVVAVASAGQPLRLVLSGLMSDVSLSSARHALSTSYTVVEGLISLDRREEGVLNTDLQGQLHLIHEAKPDLIVIVGGVDGGTRGPILQATEAAALACATLAEAECPTILYAGNSKLRAEVADLIGTDARLHAIDNVRPSLELENPGPLQAEIEELYRQQKMERLPGFGMLADWSPVPVQPAAKGLAQSLQYLASLNGINVLGVDAGGASTTIGAMVDEQLALTIRGDLGTSYNSARILDHVPADQIARWLPFEMETEEIENALYNKALRPRTIPQTREDLLLEQALARENLRLTMAGLIDRWSGNASHIYDQLPPKFHLVIGRGGVLAKAPHPGQAALMLLDAVQPVGVAGLALDQFGLLAPAGSMALVNPVAAAQVIEQDGLLSLGTVVAPVGTAREGDIALKFKIEYHDGRSLEVEVPYGSLEVIPLPSGQTATLELRPTRRFDVGLGSKGQAGKTKVEGGLLGIIIDARGRPLPFAQDPAVQQEKVQRWLWDVGS